MKCVIKGANVYSQVKTKTPIFTVLVIKYD